MITGLLGYVDLIVKIRFDLIIRISDFYNKFSLHSDSGFSQMTVADTLLAKVRTSVIARHDWCHN